MIVNRILNLIIKPRESLKPRARRVRICKIGDDRRWSKRELNAIVNSFLRWI